MVILFSPSEAKSNKSEYNKIDKDSFLFPDRYAIRKTALEKYQHFIDKASDIELKKLFGIKNEKLLDEFKTIDIFNDKTQKAVSRYSGIGYKYLNYGSMDKSSQDFIDNNMIIFSNLFGPLLAKDKIPFYKLKQGEKIEDFCFENYYKKNFKDTLDTYLKDQIIIDLRASFYDKFYIPSQNYITFKFLKNSKSISHYAKAYRGIVAKEIALARAKNEKELMSIEFPSLKISEIKTVKNRKEYIFEIMTS